MDLLRNEVASDRVLFLVQQRCIHFTPDDAALTQIATAGGSAELLQGLRALGRPEAAPLAERPKAAPRAERPKATPRPEPRATGPAPRRTPARPVAEPPVRRAPPPEPASPPDGELASIRADLAVARPLRSQGAYYDAGVRLRTAQADAGRLAARYPRSRAATELQTTARTLAADNRRACLAEAAVFRARGEAASPCP